ncbi:unnamed protein product, partial [Gulo gulo]
PLSLLVTASSEGNYSEEDLHILSHLTALSQAQTDLQPVLLTSDKPAATYCGSLSRDRNSSAKKMTSFKCLWGLLASGPVPSKGQFQSRIPQVTC